MRYELTVDEEAYNRLPKLGKKLELSVEHTDDNGTYVIKRIVGKVVSAELLDDGNVRVEIEGYT